MTKLSFWIQIFEPYIIDTVQSFPVLPLITAVRFLRHNPLPSEDTLYIGTLEKTRKYLTHMPPDRTATIFVSGCDEPLLSAARRANVNLVCTTLDILEIHDRLSEGLRNTLNALIRKKADPVSASADLSTLLDDIVKNGLTNEAEINRRLALLPRVPQTYLSLVILEFENAADTDLSDLFTRLETVFPESNITKYGEEVVLLLSCSDRQFQPAPAFAHDTFCALLSDYNAFASISNATSHRSRLHTSYVLTMRILRLGKALRTHVSDRLFFFEDYAEYYMIDLCFNSFHELFGHNDIIYLTHPDAIAIARYDREYNSNLLDVLYHYCLCSENITQTAQSAYMHRNTVTAKIAKIRELIRADLGSGQIRQRMIFSCKILRYYEKYVGIDLEERLGQSQN